MDSSVRSLFSKKAHWTVEDVQNHVCQSKAVIFGRGDCERPRCGYTKEALEVLKSAGCEYEVIDVELERSASAALKAYAGPVHLPAVFVDGELVGTSDNLANLISSGELVRKLAD
jgi:monothiol glutaredoxin